VCVWKREREREEERKREDFFANPIDSFFPFPLNFFPFLSFPFSAKKAVSHILTEQLHFAREMITELKFCK